MNQNIMFWKTNAIQLMQNMSCSSKQKTLISTIMFDETNVSQAMCIIWKAAKLLYLTSNAEISNSLYFLKNTACEKQ